MLNYIILVLLTAVLILSAVTVIAEPIFCRIQGSRQSFTRNKDTSARNIEDKLLRMGRRYSNIRTRCRRR